MPETTTIDTLFLELSQFTQATTAKELALTADRDRLAAALEEAQAKEQQWYRHWKAAQETVAEVEALRAQVRLVREPLEVLWMVMGLTIQRFDSALGRQIAAALAATAPTQEAPE